MKISLIAFLVSVLVQVAHAGWKPTSEPVRLAGGQGEIYMRPVWSPDGTSFAFTSVSYRGLWVMYFDSGEIDEISDEWAAGFGFSWSNSANAIVTRVARFEAKRRYNAVKVFDLATGTSWLLSDYQTHLPGLPRWSNDDRHVYIFDGRRLATLESRIAAATPLQKNSFNRQAYYLQNGKIAIEQMDKQSSNVYDPLRGQRYINIAISPDESKIAFEVMGGNMYVMNVDGTGLVDLGIGYRPQWSPDSNYLVYMISKDDGHDFTQSDIYIIKTDGTEKTRITDTDDKLEMNPSWAPDGERILFDTYREGVIYVVEVTK